MKVSISLLLLLSSSFGTSSSHSGGEKVNGYEIVDSGYVENVAPDPLRLGAMHPENGLSTPRHRQEKAHLLKRMDRKSGTWGSSHPRYRLLEALYGLDKYQQRNKVELERWRTLYKYVGKQQKKTLEKVVGYKQKLNDVEALFHKNQVLCNNILENALGFYDIKQEELDNHIKEAEADGRQADRISVGQTLKHFVRDWADEGAKERDEAFPCILSTLRDIRYQLGTGSAFKVLLPGSGLGRLGHEIADIGDFEVTVNEWSMHMNVAYRYLETLPGLESFAVHPFIDGMSHHATTMDMLREIMAPNTKLNPGVVLVEGDFNTAFAGQEGQFDLIVTHFFIDTARNLMAYFDTIHRLLKPGGKWMNFGPLLYGTGPFVQLSLDEIIAVVEEMGFSWEDLSDECGTLTFEGKKVRSKQAEYGFNGKALTRNAYLAQAWLVRKI